MSITTFNKKLVKNASFSLTIDDQELLSNLIRSLGPSIFINESEKFFNKEELQKIKNNFLIKKLNLTESKELDDSFRLITNEFINSDFVKDRVYFYFFIVKHFHKEEIFIKRNKDHRSGFKNRIKSIYRYLFKKNIVSKSSENKLIDFGDGFIKKQKDLDQDIFEIVDKNFSSLY